MWLHFKSLGALLASAAFTPRFPGREAVQPAADRAHPATASGLVRERQRRAHAAQRLREGVPLDHVPVRQAVRDAVAPLGGGGLAVAGELEVVLKCWKLKAQWDFP